MESDSSYSPLCDHPGQPGGSLPVFKLGHLSSPAFGLKSGLVPTTSALRSSGHQTWIRTLSLVLLGSGLLNLHNHCSCCSGAQSCPTLCNPVDCSTPGFPALTVSQSLLRFTSIVLEMPSNHFILCRPLLLLSSVFPRNRVLSNESALCIRWPKYWSFSFSISLFSGYSGLISFRIDWFGGGKKTP